MTFTVYTGPGDTTLTNGLLATNSGITIVDGSIVLKASGQEAVNFYDGSLASLGIGAGLLLTSGTTPGTSNTVGWFGTDNSTTTFNNGDADIDAVVNTVFQTQSYDATTLSFDFTVTDPTATSVSFDLVFGSDEFPEWVDQFVDSAIVMVNGVNYALFNHDPLHPLSVVSANLAAGYFQDNAGNVLPIEYDGVSHVLKIVAPIVPGASNHIKIGIADTGDHIYDSGIFLANLSAGNIPGSGVVNPTTGGTDGIDTVTGSAQDEYFDLQGGDDIAYAGAGDDIVVAGAGNDVVYGGSGADQMKGDAGDDSLDGGDGNDTAVFSGASGGYSVAYNAANNSYTITDSSASEGTDTLTSVEFAKFSDGLFTLGLSGLTLVTDPVTPPSNTPGLVFLTGIGGQGQTLTAQVSDADGVPVGGVSYAWQADGVGLGGTGNTFVVGAGQVGQNITVTASYTDLAAVPNGESLTSAAKYISAPGNGDFTITLLNLSAPIGASVMNPLTTLVKNAIDLGVSPNEAGIIIKSALGIAATVNLQHYDSWAVLQTNPADTAALAVEKTAVQVAVMTSLGSDETGMALTQAILLAHSNNTTLDLTNEAVILDVLGQVPLDPSDPFDPVNMLVHEIWDRNDTISAAAVVAEIEGIWADIQSGLDVVLSDSIGTLSVHINQAPTGTAMASLGNGVEGTAYTVSAIDLLQGFSDADGDSLSVSGLAADNGSVTDNGDATFTITPAPDFTGPVELIYNVIDNNGGSAPASQLFVIAPNAVTQANTAPTTSAVTLAAIAEDSGVRVITQAELLGNANDVDGDSLTATGLSIASGNGSLTDNGDGTWAYTPALNDDTSVSFNYSVSDGSLSAAGSATLDITPVNDAPTTSAVTLAAIAEDSGVRVITQAELLGNANDVDGDSLTATGLSIASGNGSLTDNGDGTWAYTPALNDDTSVSFNYSVSDGSLSAAGSATLDITSLNDAPTTSAVTLAAIAEDSGVRVITQAELLGNANDVDGDSLTATGLSIASGNGSLTDNGDGTWAYTPALNDDTSVSFNYSVSDGSLSAAGSAMLDITPLAGVTLIGTVKADSLLGSGHDDTLYGLGGNDTLNGLAGNDTLVGGAGSDTYVVDSAGDVVIEAAGAGTDLVQASVSYSLAANVENLTLTGTAAINGAGNALANTLTGNSRNNVLDGGAGRDKMAGGAGDDTYYVDSTGDAVSEATGAGTDTVVSSLTTYTLGRNIENLSLDAGANNGTGNTLDNMLLGNGAANILSGLAGNDLLDGGAGNDILIGGAGNDRLTGGDGADIFFFEKALSASNNLDTISDFLAIDDTIQLENAIFKKLTTTGTLSADNFTANTDGKAGDMNDFIVYDTDSGALYYDVDGSGKGAAIQFATLELLGQPAVVTATDFIVI